MTGDIPTGRGLVCSPSHGYPYGGDLDVGRLHRGNGEPGRAYRYRGEAVIGDVLPVVPTPRRGDGYRGEATPWGSFQ